MKNPKPEIRNPKSEWRPIWPSVIRHSVFGLLLLLSTLNPQLSTCFAQGTAFTYQGRLDDGGNPAHGAYDFRFRLASDALGNNYVGGAFLTNGIFVTNGLFTTTMDFGAGFFNGSNYWLEIDVRTNGALGYTALFPLQLFTPAPYAIFANSASNLLGTVSPVQISGPIPVSQLSGTVAAATNFIASLNGDVTGTQSATVVAGVGGQSAANVASATIAANAATNANTAGSIVKRDGSGNFSAGSVTLSGNLNLPTTSGSSAGVITTGGARLLHAYGSANFFAGPYAGNFLMTGIYNTGLGYEALPADTSGVGNVAVGTLAMQFNTNGNYNTALGAGALQNNTSGGGNTACGNAALVNNLNASDNTAVGASALFSNTNGVNNTAVGASAMTRTTSGGGNSALGNNALYNNTSGANNTVVGNNALVNNLTASGNTAVGSVTLYSNTNGQENVAVGDSTLYNNTSGGNNTAIGAAALSGNTTGSGNIALGSSAGGNITTGSGNIDIGNGGVAGDTNIIRIGSSGQVNTFIAGIYSATAVSGAAVYVNSSGQLGTLTSSARFKQNVREMGDASDTLLALRPVTFQYKPDIDPQGIRQFGLIAEQVEKVDPDLVVHDEQHGIYTVRYQAVDAMLLNEFLKQHQTVNEQQAEIQELKARLEKLEQLIHSMKGDNK